MSHINLYAVATDHKNLIRCRYCEKVYKIDNGSSGFIRHLRCKHPEVLYQMGPTNHALSPPKEQKGIELFKTETTENNNTIEKQEEEGNDMLTMMMQDLTSNHFFANFMSQVETSQDNVPRLPEKRPRISPTPIENPTSPLVESSEEQELKMFSTENPLEEFLNKINKITQQNGDMSEGINGVGEASTSAGAMEMPISLKGSREPTPNSSALGGTENLDSPPQHVFNPMLPFGCVFCPCSFGEIKDLTFHVGHVHRTRYRCNGCQAEFVQSQQLESHFTMAHVIGGETRNNQ